MRKVVWEVFVYDDFLNEKHLYGATVKNGPSRIKTTQISEEFQNDHQMLPQLLGWLAVKSPI